MARNKRPIVLEKLAQDPTDELKTMVADLTSRNASGQSRAGQKPTPWSRRFVASGKPVPSARIRLGYDF